MDTYTFHYIHLLHMLRNSANSMFTRAMAACLVAAAAASRPFFKENFHQQINGQLVLLLCMLQGIDSFAADQKKLEEQLAQLAATL